MTISQITKAILADKSARLIRPKRIELDALDKRIQYDAKFHEGSSKGWIFLDLTTASALDTCYNALSAESQFKWDMMSVSRLVDFAWKHVS